MESKGRLSTEDCIRFDDFVEGKSMGAASVTLTEELIERWVTLYPADGAVLPVMPDGTAATRMPDGTAATRMPDGTAATRMPDGMTSVLVMRAYMEVLSPRPPGNIHAGQAFTMGTGVMVGDQITTELVCARKWERKDKRWLELETVSRHDTGESAFTGLMTMIWAL